MFLIHAHRKLYYHISLYYDPELMVLVFTFLHLRYSHIIRAGSSKLGMQRSDSRDYKTRKFVKMVYYYNYWLHGYYLSSCVLFKYDVSETESSPKRRF